MKKILVTGFTDNIGGIETFYMAYYRKLDKKKLQIDFIKTTDSIVFEEELSNNGSKIYKLINFKKNPFLYKKQLKEIILKEKYDIVHVNMLSAANILPLKVAHKCGVKKVVAHSHNNGIPKGKVRAILHYLNRRKIVKFSNLLLACSESAGKWLFGENAEFKVIKNAIQIERFLFDSKKRQELRKKYNIQEKFVIGNIGRFCEQKNQDFLLDVFIKYLKYDSNAVLMMVGKGEDKEKILDKINKNNIESNVILLENIKEIWEIYNIFDLFVLPSKFEGLGIVAIEAQANGLSCIFSDKILKELKITKNIYFLELEVEKWIEKIKKVSKNSNRQENILNINKAGYDISTQASVLQDFYLK